MRVSSCLPAWLPLGNNVSSFDEFALFPIARRQRSALFFALLALPPAVLSTFVGVQRSHSTAALAATASVIIKCNEICLQ